MAGFGFQVLGFGRDTALTNGPPVSQTARPSAATAGVVACGGIIISSPCHRPCICHLGYTPGGHGRRSLQGRQTAAGSTARGGEASSKEAGFRSGRRKHRGNLIRPIEHRRPQTEGIKPVLPEILEKPTSGGNRTPPVRPIRPSPPPPSLGSRLAVPPNLPPPQADDAGDTASLADNEGGGPPAVDRLGSKWAKLGQKPVDRRFSRPVPVKHGKGLRSESSGKRIRLGSRAFSSKEELFDLFSGFLGSKNPGDIVEGEAADMIIDLIKTAHRDPARKFGSGVVGVEVGLHPEYKVRCFMLRRADSTLVDVSYRKCINNLLTSNWVNEVPHILNLRNLSGELLKNNAAKQQDAVGSDEAGSPSAPQGRGSKSHPNEFKPLQELTVEEIVADIWDIIAGMERLDHMTAMLAITVLGRCCEANESMRHEVEGHPAFREIYLAITSSLSEYSARHTSQIMWAVSRFQLPEPFPMPSFAYHTIPKLPELSTSEMVAMLQGFARMQNPPTRAFFNAFTEEFLKRTDGEDMDPFFFLAVVNSLGRLEKRPSKLIRGIEMEIVRRVDELPVLLLAQILWAMASTGWQAKTSRLDTLARRIVSAGGAGPSRAQALSLTLHALARMTYLPVGDLWDDLENAIGDVLEDMSVRDLKSTIWASAFLDLKLRPDILYRLVERIAEEFKQLGGSITTPNLISVALVLVMLAQFDHPSCKTILEAVEMRADQILQDPLRSSMLHQIQMVLEVEAPHMSLKLKPGMLSSAAEEWKKQVKLTTVSPYHMKVARVLREMGMSILIEHRTADRHFSMDIALVPSDWKQGSFPQPDGEDGKSQNEKLLRKLRLKQKTKAADRAKVAIEVDGPAHFSWNVHKPLGSMLIRRRLLKARGWNTISVPYYAWAVIPRDLKSAYLRLLLSSHDVDLAAFIPGLNTSRGDAISDEERDQLLALLGEADRQFVHRPEAEVELSDDDVDDDEYDDDVDDDDGSDCDRQEVGILDLHAEDLASQTGLSKQSEDEEDEVGLTMDEEDLDLEYILKEVEEAGMEARKRRFSQSRSGAVAHTTWLLDSSEDPGLDEDVWLKMHESDDVIIDPEDSGSDRVECTDAEQCLLSTVAAQTATLRDGAATDVDGGSASQRQQLDRHGTGRPGYRCGICNELGHNRRTCPTLRETDQ